MYFSHVHLYSISTMKNIKALLAIACLTLVGCSSTTKLASVCSPDRKARITLYLKERRGIQLPVPEPAEIKSLQANFVVQENDREVYKTGFHDVGVNQSIPHAFDAAWAPDSAHVACRSHSTLLLVSRDGTIHQPKLGDGNIAITSFKWVSGSELLVVSKEINQSVESQVRPQRYPGYLCKSKGIRIQRLSLNGLIRERFSQSLKNPVFLFHSFGFENQEISPYSNQVAFSDGASLCIYDDEAGKVVASVPIPGSLDGIWWEAKSQIIFGTGLLSGAERFFRFNIGDAKITECTKELWPMRRLKYDSVDWFRSQDSPLAHSVFPDGVLREWRNDASETSLRRWISEDFSAQVRVIDHYKKYKKMAPSVPVETEVWLLNCREGFPSLRVPKSNRTRTLAASEIAYELLEDDLYYRGIRLGGKRADLVWQLDWKAGDSHTELKGTLYPHADGEILRIERVTRPSNNPAGVSKSGSVPKQQENPAATPDQP